MNFLSTGNAYTEIDLSKNLSTLIIGSNGAGKSTLLDALCFALFGKPYRKINKPNLLNSINGKDCMVECEFTIGNDEYIIRRGIKPAVFEIFINGNLENQPGSTRDYQDILEKNILKMNFKSFTQIVILGASSFVPFMQLPAAGRRSIIEELLDIQIFSRMNIILKDNISENKSDMASNQYALDLTQDKIDIQNQYVEKLRKKNSGMLLEFQKKITEVNDMVLGLKEDKKKVSDKIEKLIASGVDEGKTHKNSQKTMSVMDRLEDKQKRITKRKTFFENNETCPTCEQQITEEIKTKHICASTESLKEVTGAIFTLQAQYDVLQTKIEAFDKISGQLAKERSVLWRIDGDIKSHKATIKGLKESIKKIEEADDEDGDNKKALADLTESLKEITNKAESLTKQREMYNVAAEMLKDRGIKSRIIKQYIPIMNNFIAKYLAALDFFVEFELDEEFSEKIKSRYRDEFSYGSFSEGEKLRIDLALLFTWRAVAKIKNSANTNLLILDEVFDASMDTNGCEEFLKLLQQIDDVNIFVISHNVEELFDKFPNHIKFEKTNNFSTIV
jgi:DNA repair exonuclease SbcCD ATPase subunit